MTRPTAITLAAAALLSVACDGGHVSGSDLAPPAASAELHRLTVVQYQNSVRDLLGADIAVPSALEPDSKLHGYTSVAAGQQTISPVAAEQYEAAARDLAHQVVSDPARRAAVIGCDAPDADCLRTFFARLGRRAWRRPLESAEVDALLAVTDAAAASIGEPWVGVEYGIAALLQSPYFLYRVERGRPDRDYPARLVLEGHEVAARLSFLVWNTTPDDELLDAAEAGDLDSADGVRNAARRLLASPRARDALVAFYAEYLNFDRFATLTKSAELYPQYSPGLVTGMKGEIERQFARIVFDEQVDYRDILTSTVTFVNPELAALYGVAPPEGEGVTSDTFVERDLGPGAGRGGLLTTAGLLALYAHDTVTSPTLRGKFVRQNLLCEDIPPPPPGVNTSLDGVEGDTLREQLEAHRADPVCATCHSKMDPIGFGFESFDPVGQLRDTEASGAAIDSTGDLDGVAFDGPAELTALLADDPRVPACFVRQLYRFSTGHLELEREQPAIDRLADEFADRGYRVTDLLVELVASDGFRYAALPDTDPVAAGDDTEEDAP
ncbi:MAG TPA: DUF1592 domain-containing protein [Kofleriaceae bacterium]|nr:DUF1592 domain-containing protein [Kofleriaceae bacterium]